MKRFTHQVLAITSMVILITTSACQRVQVTPTATLPSLQATPTPGPQQPGLTPSVTQPLPTSTLQVPSSQLSIISAGGTHTCLLTASGGVRCWGDNSYGQLGNGNAIPNSVPVEVQDLGGEVVSVEAGGNQTCVVTAAGGVKCWGLNGSGELGNGTSEDSMTPVDVIGLESGVVAVSVTDSRACAVTATGSVKCWGYKWYGQEAGMVNFNTTPVELPGLSGGVAAISLGYNHGCALMTTGGVKCWGFNSLGQLGDGSTKEESATPVDVVDLDSKITAISLGTNHACALTVSGGVKCWGDNNWGQLGNGTRQPSNIPLYVTGLESGVTAISAGSAQSCALMVSGGVKCWGSNQSGTLGDGTTENRYIPVNVTGLGSEVVAISAGSAHTCVLEASGGVKCWGDNKFGQLGDGLPPLRVTPGEVMGLSSDVSMLSVGIGDACALTLMGDLKCWGIGFVSTSKTSERSVPGKLTNLAGEVRALSVGSSHSVCILTNSGAVKCSYGDETFVDVAGLESGMRAVSVGIFHSCALTETGGVMCWGDPEFGGLGDGTANPSETPVDVVGLGSSVTALALGFSHTCALMASGGVKCWGWNGFGQLGDGTETDRLTPVEVIGLNDEITAIAAGDYHTCALTAAGGVKCWGLNEEGQLGDGAPTFKAVVAPVDAVGLSQGVTAITAGENHTCALLSSGEVKCWGWNHYGQLADGTVVDHSTPAGVINMGGVVAAIDSGQNYTCSLTSSGGVNCWGDNLMGQMGDGRLLWSSLPVQVVGLDNLQSR
jgi:alpha-tubulin suppressor-like RCC1 family protein